MTNSKSFDDARYEAAAAWHARLEGDATEADWLAFTAWLEADAQNRSAFDAVSDAAALVDERKADIAAALNTQMDNVVPLARARVSRRTFGIGIAAAAAAALAAVFVMPPRSQEWSTAVGENRTITLTDGSEIHMNTDTAITVAFARDSRGVTLRKGEAHFDVKSDPDRPFVVLVGDRRIEVVGTAFNISRTDGKIAVTVTRGIVNVAVSAAEREAVRLTAGDQYRSTEGQSAFQVVKVDPANTLAWRNDRLIFEDAPLSQVITALNRHFSRKLAVADAGTGALRFTGILKIDDETTVAKRLEGLLPITVQNRGNDLVLVRRSSD